jgi:hypothetical protein
MAQKIDLLQRAGYLGEKSPASNSDEEVDVEMSLVCHLILKWILDAECKYRSKRMKMTMRTRMRMRMRTKMKTRMRTKMKTRMRTN